MRLSGYFDRRRERRTLAAAIAREARRGAELASEEFRRECDKRIAQYDAERKYAAEYPALRERFILAALTGLAAHPVVLSSESAWLACMAVERAEAALLAAGYAPPP